MSTLKKNGPVSPLLVDLPCQDLGVLLALVGWETTLDGWTGRDQRADPSLETARQRSWRAPGHPLSGLGSPRAPAPPRRRPRSPPTGKQAKMKPITLVLSDLLFLLLCCGPAAESRPNIVFVLADDLGWGDVGWNNPAMADVTPHLTKLAKSGMVLSQYYVQQVSVSIARRKTHKYWTKGVLPEPRSLVDRALPLSHWETGVIMIVDQFDIINYDEIFWQSNFLSPPSPITKTKPNHDGNEIIFRREQSNHFNPLALHLNTSYYQTR